MSLKSKIKDLILSNATVSNNRTIGVEEESLVFQRDGKRIPVKSKTTFDAKTLIQNLNQKTKNNGFYTLEPGGQVEWSSPPRPDLNQLYQAMKKHQSMLETELLASQLKIIYFSQKELCNILSAYSIKVSEGIWKDYAIDNSISFALFSIFRNTYEKPILMIQKSFINNKKIYMFSLMSQNGNLTNSKELKNIVRGIFLLDK